jgi:hypothetical protein
VTHSAERLATADQLLRVGDLVTAQIILNVVAYGQLYERT